MFALDEKYYWKLRKIFLVDAKASKSEHPNIQLGTKVVSRIHEF